MKIVFMGTPAFAVPSLRALLKHHDVLAVCTQPDRPAGRGHKLQTSPVKALAEEHGIPVFQPETLHISNKEIRGKLSSLGADIFAVAAYGLLLPKGVLNMPPYGCVNVHASLLPKYRGASPIHSALLNGDSETGITIMQMDSGIDTGDIILQRTLSVSADERFTSLHDRMAELGGTALLEALEQIKDCTKTPQDGSLSSYAPLIKKTDGQINWNDTSEKIVNMTRAFDPVPGCYTACKGEILKIWRCTASSDSYKDISAGTVISADSSSGLVVKTGDGAVIVTELQASGKKRMSAADFLRGQSINFQGERLCVNS
jgi:methionyl-tRNA formyltransferase